MKIGLLAVRTLNYGSLLQSYATQEVLREMGHDVEIISYKKTNILKQGLRLLYPPMLERQIQVVYKKLYLNLIDKKLGEYFQCKERAMETFIDEHFISSEVYVGRKNLIEKSKKYDVFVLGSDQVWNPLNYGADYFSMSWVPDEIPKITYAASFGVSDLPKYQRKKTRRDIQRIQFVSVREKSASELIYKMTGRRVPVVADPTILIDRTCWDKIKGEKIIEGKYIMCYFLGDNPNHRETARRLSEALKLPIVTLPHGDEIVKSDFGFGNVIPEGVGPSEFINLISNAQYVCTDSFHGTVFSILYHKQFITFKRYTENVNGKESTNSRLTSLLSLLELKNRLFDSSKGLDTKMFDEIDFSIPDLKLRDLREKSYSFLAGVLDSIIK
ncbi:MAG: polysaccharide pyruvyl transferase family protein [Lachnospiraceae bacterium]|nr:polysaccharide pyruvyl transferase family protein [Lachnospiraceae bacterium]